MAAVSSKKSSNSSPVDGKIAVANAQVEMNRSSIPNRAVKTPPARLACQWVGYAARITRLAGKSIILSHE